MNWFNKINSIALKNWIIANGSGNSISPGRRLDPFGSSMRKFNNAHSWMQQIYDTNNLLLPTPRATDQAKTDLKSSQLVDYATNLLTPLGNQTYTDWTHYAIPVGDANYEIHRCFLLCKNALQVSNTLYKEFFSFWKELKQQYSFNHLISSPELLYFFSYFSKGHQGFNPYNAIRGLNMSDADFNIPIDWNIIKAYYNDQQLNAAADRYNNTINGYVERQGRTNFCTALELLANPENAMNVVNGLVMADPLKELLLTIVSENSNLISMELNKIYFGAPGTGKSRKISEYTTNENSVRMTFHPDTDYASFVGSYKPTENPAQAGGITYKFIPQQFLQAYIKAWVSNENIFLVIEEINRGNCAQIFGDIFQLIERNADGYSAYPVDADADLSKFLKLYFEAERAKGGADADRVLRYFDYFGGSFNRLVLPNNLFIHATMNTSDQSLFPIDSAFKRRWDWEYIPIEFDGTEANDYLITIEAQTFSWRGFIEAINKKIEIVTESEDKKLGQFFIKSFDGNISEKTFKTKVMFYLWNDVLRDEAKSDDRYFFRGKTLPADIVETPFTFNDLFSANSSQRLRDLMTYLNIEAQH